MSKRKAVKAMVTAECDRTGTDISIEENRAAIASRVLNLLERPKKDWKVEVEGHARVTQTVGGTKLFCGAMDSAFRGPLSRPVALGIIAEEGYSHYLTDGGKGNFTCSKWWLSHIFREQKWSYRKPPTNSRMMPDNWISLTFDMILRTEYFVRRYDFPEVLFVSADHTEIMHLGWWLVHWDRSRHNSRGPRVREKIRSLCLLHQLLEAIPFALLKELKNVYC